MRRLRAFALAAAVGSAALVGAGCYDDGSSPELTDEQYVVAVREAIGPVATESQDLITQANEAEQVAELVKPLGSARRVYQQASDRLAEISPPTEVEELHERLVHTQQKIADAAEAARQAAREGDRGGLERFRKAGDRYRERAEKLSEEFSERGFEL